MTFRDTPAGIEVSFRTDGGGRTDGGRTDGRTEEGQTDVEVEIVI